MLSNIIYIFINNKTMPSFSYPLLFLLFMISPSSSSFIHTQTSSTLNILFTQCYSSMRNISFTSSNNTTAPANITNQVCFPCEANAFSFYNTNTNKVECRVCPEGTTNTGGDIVINRWNEETIRKFSMRFTCKSFRDGKRCNQWEMKDHSVLSNQTYQTSNNLTLVIKAEREAIMKIYYQKSKIAAINIYNNNVYQTISFTKSPFISISIKEGTNVITIEHTSSELNTPSFLLIHNIIIKNALFTSFTCNLLPSISSLPLSPCEYDAKCNPNDDICTERFYYHNLSDTCDVLLNQQNVKYSLLPSAQCKELAQYQETIRPCEQCRDGQYRRYVNETHSQCVYCNEGRYKRYDSNEVYDDGKCVICESGIINRIFYIYPTTPNEQRIKTKIVDVVGSVIINSEKFDVNKENDFYVEINNTAMNSSRIDKYSNEERVTIDLGKGEYEILIKGRNFNMKNITIVNSDLGGGYQCVSEKSENLVKQCNEEEKNLKYYSDYYHQCMTCPIFTHVEYNTSYEIPKSYCALDRTVFSNTNLKEQIDFSNFMNSINENEGITFVSPKGDNITLVLNGKSYVYDQGNNIYYGREITNVNLVNANEKRGVVVSFESGDKCNDNNDYRAYVFVKCDKNAIVYEVETNAIDSENCEASFEIRTINACPICTSLDAKKIATSSCRLSVLEEFYEEGSNCIIVNIEGNNLTESSETEILGINNKSAITSSNVFKHFGLGNSFNKSIDYSKEKFIYSQTMKVECVNNYGSLLILLLSFIGGIVLLIFSMVLGCVLCYYFKTLSKSTYSALPQNSSIELSEGGLEENEAKPDVNIF